MTTYKPKSRAEQHQVKRLSLTLLWFVLSLILLSFVTSCRPEKASVKDCQCSTPATIKDYRGMDGCGWILELENGERLQPLFSKGWCATPPIPKVLTDSVEWVNGKQVRINYTARPDMNNSCMVGKIVEITCICESTAKKSD
jgi:hypothetical protein